MSKLVIKTLVVIFGAAILFGVLAPSPLVAFFLTLGTIVLAGIYVAATSFLAFLDSRS